MTKKLHGIAKHRHLARVQRDHDAGFEMTPFNAIGWLLVKAKAIKIGTNQPLQIANLIRRLIKERADLQAKLDKALEPPVKPKPRERHPTEGNGSWDS